MSNPNQEVKSQSQIVEIDESTRQIAPEDSGYDLNREEIRNGPPLGTTAVNLGRLGNLQRHFPEIWRAIALEFPELQRF